MRMLPIALALFAALHAPSPGDAAPSPAAGVREEALRHYLAGRWLERSWDRSGALAEYSRALTESPEEAGVLLRLAELATHDGQPLRTIEYADRVLSRDTRSARAHWLRGAALIQFNTLTPIVAYSELLLKEVPDLPAPSRRHLTIMQKCADDIAHIVARMREFYRRRYEGEPLAKVNLNEIIQEVVELTRPRWRDLSQREGICIAIESQLEPDLPCLLSDPSEMRESADEPCFQLRGRHAAWRQNHPLHTSGQIHRPCWGHNCS